MSEEKYRLAKIILGIILLGILAIYVYNERFVIYKGALIDKYTHEVYRCKVI